jgi:hypothetical protein
MKEEDKENDERGYEEKEKKKKLRLEPFIIIITSNYIHWDV